MTPFTPSVCPPSRVGSGEPKNRPSSLSGLRFESKLLGRGLLGLTRGDYANCRRNLKIESGVEKFVNTLGNCLGSFAGIPKGSFVIGRRTLLPGPESTNCPVVLSRTRPCRPPTVSRSVGACPI